MLVGSQLPAWLFTAANRARRRRHFRVRAVVIRRRVLIFTPVVGLVLVPIVEFVFYRPGAAARGSRPVEAGNSRLLLAIPRGAQSRAFSKLQVLVDALARQRTVFGPPSPLQASLVVGARQTKRGQTAQHIGQHVPRVKVSVVR